MTSENYRQILNNEFDIKEMSKEDFDNTLMYFAELYHQEKLNIHGVRVELPKNKTNFKLKTDYESTKQQFS